MPDRGPLPQFELGFPRTDMRRKLVQAVLNREKTATASLREMYEPFTSDPLPKAGGRFVLVDYSDEPCGLVEVTSVEVVPLQDVDVQFAVDEGEGFISAEDWHAAALRYWAPYSVTPRTLVVCERFQLL